MSSFALRRQALAVLSSVVCLLLHAAPSLAAVTLKVERAGNVTWDKGPCSADVFSNGGRDVPSLHVDDVAVPFNLPAGKHDVVVACATTEGVVKKAVVVQGGGAVSTRVVLEPGFILASVLRFDTPADADLTFYDEGGHVLAKGRDRAIIPLPAGRVRILAEVFDKRVGHAVFGTAFVQVKAKEKTRATVDTTDGQLTVTLTDNGVRANGVAALRVPGQKAHLVELRAGEKGDVPPGTYELVTQLEGQLDAREVVTPGVVIAPDKATTKSVAHRTGTVVVRVLVDGKTPSATAKLDVALHLPGAPDAFYAAALSRSGAPEPLKVAPGRVRVVVRQSEPLLDDGSARTGSAEVTVTAGKAAIATLDLRAAHLDVAVTRGGAPAPLDVTLTLAGGTAPVAQKRAAADGRVAFDVLPGRYLLKAIEHAPQGDVQTQKSIRLETDVHVGAALDLDVGTAAVMVFEGGVSVPAEVRFFRQEEGEDNAKATPEGEPVLRVPAGQDAVLPPGVYTLVVVRKGKEKTFSDLRVAAGRTVERSVELSAK